jgi:hypothetical protein
MRKNRLAATWPRWIRARPLVPEAAFQDAAESYPGTGAGSPNPGALQGSDPGLTSGCLSGSLA